MESEKVKEIKKGLKFMMGLVLSNKLPYIDGNTPKQIAYEEIFNYINELESENKELKRYKLDWLNSEKMHLQADMEDTEFELFCANKSLGKVRTENQQLKDRIAELEKEIEELAKWQRKAIHYYKTAKSYGVECIVDNDIDETLKEFIEC